MPSKAYFPQKLIPILVLIEKTEDHKLTASEAKNLGNLAERAREEQSKGYADAGQSPLNIAAVNSTTQKTV